MNNFIYDTFVKLIKTNEVILLLLSIIVLVIIVILIELANVQDTIAISVLSSMMASILILIIYKLLDAKKDTILKIYNKYGLKNLYSKKTDATDDFSKKIMQAKNRIWAIGMTNKSFIKQQKENLNVILKKQDNIDIKIIYWNDCTLIEKQDKISKSIIDVQLALENQNSITCTSDINSQNTIREIHNSIQILKQDIDENKYPKIEIGFLSVPSSFSCLVIDDDIFFFPFLSGNESNISPMILCDAKKEVGKPIINHFTYIFKQKWYYNSKKLSDNSFITGNGKDEDCLNGK